MSEQFLGQDPADFISPDEEVVPGRPRQVATAELDLAAPVAFEQPEVPAEAPVEIWSEDQILAGSEEDQMIGKVVEEELSPQQVQSLQTRALLKLAGSIEGMIKDQQRIRQKSYAEIDPSSPFNPEGKRNRTKARGVIFQHGIMVNPMMVREEEIILLNSLKPGRYIGRTVEVVRMRDGSVNITWPNKTIQQRMEFNAQFPTFLHLCKRIVQERVEREERRKRGDYESEEIF